MARYNLASSLPPNRRHWEAISDWLKAQSSPARWLPPRWHHPVIGYFTAIALALLASGLTSLLEAAFPPLVLQGSLLGLVTVLVALTWGQGPSLLATFVGTCLLAFLILPPEFSWNIDKRADAVGLAVYLLTGITVSLIAGQKGRAHRRAEQAALQAQEARQHAERLALLLRNAHVASEQERQRLQQVLDVLPIGVFLTDTQENLLQMNAAMRELRDLEVAPIGENIRTLGKGWWPTNALPTSTQERALPRALRTGEGSSGEEVEIETREGRHKTILHSVAPMRDETGAIAGGVVANVDITERKHLEEALRVANQQMDTFLAVASHELKTPLTSLLLGLQLAQRRAGVLQAGETEALEESVSRFEPLNDALELTIHQGARLDRLVNDLLDVSRIQAGRLELRKEPADLAAVVCEAVEEQREVAPGRKIYLELPSTPLPPLFIDPGRIGQVVTNYLTNALKYSAEDCEVGVGLEAKESWARVWVRDKGPGIPLAAQEHIWDRFHRVAGIEVQSGTGVGLGLGLHISRTMIEEHGGQVGLESAPGQGSTFWFTLPLAS
jgi:signal transduction histidine kinase